MGADPFALGGRRIVVTGGAGRLGSAIVRALAAAGGRVIVLDKDGEGWARLAPAIEGEATFERCDVTDLEAIPGVVEGLDRRNDGLAAWFNCAYPRTEAWGAAPERDSPESWRRNVDMQMNSYCLFAAHAARSMAARGGGSVVNVASIYGMVAPDFSVYEGTDMTTPAAYAAIKGGVIAHSRYLASQYGRQGVRVNALCPGGVLADQPERFVAAYSRRTALGRMAEADEIGPPAVFLAADASSYVTGTTLVVDGGWTAL